MGKCNVDINTFCNDKEGVLQRLLSAVALVKKGEPITRACYCAGVDYAAFRKLLKMNFNITEAVGGIDSEELLTWEDKLLACILGPGNYVLPDFIEAYKKVAVCLDERERIILRLRFEECYTLKETAVELNISPERVRHLEARALRKLRRPDRAKYFKYGADADVITEYEEKVNGLIKEKEELLSKLKDTVNFLEGDIKQLHEQYGS